MHLIPLSVVSIRSHQGSQHPLEARSENPAALRIVSHQRSHCHSKPKVVRIIARLNIGGPARQVCLLHEKMTYHFETRLVIGWFSRWRARYELFVSLG